MARFTPTLQGPVTWLAISFPRNGEDKIYISGQMKGYREVFIVHREKSKKIELRLYKRAHIEYAKRFTISFLFYLKELVKHPLLLYACM